MIVMCCGRVAPAVFWWLATGALYTRNVSAGVYFRHVRQLDRVLDHALVRAWRTGAGPGAERLIVDVDSFIGQAYGYKQAGRLIPKRMTNR